MYVLIDRRQIVVDGYAARFRTHGIAAFGCDFDEFGDWFRCADDADVASVEAFVLGDVDSFDVWPRAIRRRSAAPIVAMTESGELEEVLHLFASGADDVLRKPADVKEILARVAAIHRRAAAPSWDSGVEAGPIHVFFDGRDPLVCGEPLPLPRRERRILEFLMGSLGRRVNRSQIFSAVYGVFNEDVDEAVVESHVSKLRKKLRHRLGYDAISSKRYLGYTLEVPDRRATERTGASASA